MERQKLGGVGVRLHAEQTALIRRVDDVELSRSGELPEVELDLQIVAFVDQQVETVQEFRGIALRDPLVVGARRRRAEFDTLKKEKNLPRTSGQQPSITP